MGAIAANKGLYLTAATEPQAQGQQLDMQGAISQLENALSIAKALQNAANTAQAHPADTDSQTALQTALKQLTQAGIIAYAPEGIGLVSDSNIQLTSANSLTLTSENQTDISSLKNLTVASGEAVSLFAHKSGMKLFANQGKVEVQAQNDAMDIAAKQDIRMDSVEGTVMINAAKGINLTANGSYIKITSGGIELGSSGNVSIKASALQKMGAAQITKNKKILSEKILEKWISFQLPLDKNYSNLNYLILLDNGESLKGIFDKDNKAKVALNTGCSTAKIQIENLQCLENDEINTSITEVLLKKIMG